MAIDMSGATEVTSKKGTKFLKKKVMNVEVPVEFQNSYLRYDNKDKALYIFQTVKKSQEEIDAKKRANELETKKKWTAQLELNKKIDAEVEKIDSETKAKLIALKEKAKTVANDIRKAMFERKSVQHLYDKEDSIKEAKRDLVQNRVLKIAELRKDRKSVPKKFR